MVFGNEVTNKPWRERRRDALVKQTVVRQEQQRARQEENAERVGLREIVAADVAARDAQRVRGTNDDDDNDDMAIDRVLPGVIDVRGVQPEIDRAVPAVPGDTVRAGDHQVDAVRAGDHQVDAVRAGDHQVVLADHQVDVVRAGDHQVDEQRAGAQSAISALSASDRAAPVPGVIGDAIDVRHQQLQAACSDDSDADRDDKVSGAQRVVPGVVPASDASDDDSSSTESAQPQYPVSEFECCCAISRSICVDCHLYSHHQHQTR